MAEPDSSPKAPTSTLEGWAKSPFTGGGLTYDCYEKGSGPGVVLIPEIPGMTPEVLGLAEHLVDSGFTVVVPSPFGIPAHPMTVGYTLRTVLRLCVSAEFKAFTANVHRPITDYLRAVATDLALRTGGKGVGVIGMCFTGGFALATAVDSSVLAAVASQPGAPFPIGAKRKADPTMSSTEFDALAARASAGEVCAMGLRFSEDAGSPRERFTTLKTRLGDAFDVIELDSKPGNAGGFSKTAHSVLTSEVRDVPGHPALVARERVVAFLHRQLDPA
jgi:dienelactone hydrolase